jgi:hypothetical protein
LKQESAKQLQVASKLIMAAPASPSTRRLTPEDFEFGDLLGEGAYAKVRFHVYSHPIANY